MRKRKSLSLIAIYEKMDNFTAHEIQLEKGDVLYMFSDGDADQFGGPKRITNLIQNDY